ncbi:MAG: DUF6691 family protein [Myxococcota bacterium]
MKRATAFLVGMLFAGGLALSGMTQPAKVIRFFDFSDGFSSWDPSLAFVMLGGLLVYVPMFRLARARSRPVLDDLFHLPTRITIDARLVIGSALFGIGWGLAGYCPGPALTSLGAFSTPALVVVGSMILGMVLVHVVDAQRT